MLYHFPPGLLACVSRAYARPYDDPINARAGEPVDIDPDRSAQTDLFGWVWCRAPDGREGWTPEAWLQGAGNRRTLQRDFDAIELTVAVGDRVLPLFSESGFIWCRTDDGRQGWLPDAFITLTATEA